jgi:hypothetical protein
LQLKRHAICHSGDQIQRRIQRCSEDAPTDSQRPPGFRLFENGQKLMCICPVLKENKFIVVTFPLDKIPFMHYANPAFYLES